MALSDKNILITPNKGQSADPKIEFVGASSTLGPQTITLRVYPTSSGTVSLEGSAGQLFSVTNTLTGTIYSVNDVSGIPSIEVLDTGLVKFAQYSGNVLIGTGIDYGNGKVQLQGSFRAGSGWNTTPASTYFSHTLSAVSGAGNRVVNFDGNGNTPSVWWTSGSRAYGAIDAGDPGLTFWANNGSGWQKQISLGYGAVNVDTVLQQGGNQVLHAGNYNSYAPTLTGGNASGTWTINITGNAATINSQANSATITASTGVNANDIVRRDGSGHIYANHVNFNTGVENPAIANLITDNGDGWSRKSSLDHVKNSIRGVADGTWSINVTGSAASAGWATYAQIIDTRAGQYTPNDYQDNRATFEFTNQIVSDWHSAITMQGWSNGYAAWQIIGGATTSTHENWYLRSGVNTAWGSLRTILHSGNYNSYSPTLTGGGASGTWGINISGSASSATNAGYANSAGSAASVAASAITGQTGMWTSTNRPGPYRLYRRDDDSNYSVQTYWTGSYWRLYGYSGDSGHADTYVGYADNTGYATSAGTADNIDGWGFVNTGSNSATNADTINSNGISYYTSGVTNFSGNATDGALYSQRHNDSWQHQIAGDYRSGQIALRGKNAGTWQSWRTVLDSSNYSSYALPLNGGTMTGSIAMGGYNVTGAGLFGLSNGFQIQQGGSNYGQFNSWVHLNGHYGFYASINSAHIYPNNGAYGTWRMDGSRNGWAGIQFGGVNNGNVNLMIETSSNSSGFYNENYGWQFKWEGGTAYVNKNSYGGGTAATVLDSSNYNSYSPTLTGGGASGTWGINITGTATALNASNYISRRGGSGNYNTDFTNTPAGSMSHQGDDYASSNNPGNGWWFLDNYRHSNGSNYWGTQVAWGWEDNANRLAQRNVSANSWSGWVYYLNSGNYNSYSPTLTGGGASGTWGINITGNAATATSAGTATSATSASNAAYATTAGSVSSVAASAITGQVGMWATAARPGPYRLYRRDEDSNYSVQTYWTGSYWRLYGYSGDSGHADTHVGYADNSGYATSAGTASTATDSTKVPLTGGTMTGTLFINSKLRVNTASGPSDNAYGTATDIPMYMSGSTRTQSTFLIENNVNSSIEYPVIVIRRTLTPVGSRFGGMIRFADKNSSGTEISSQIYSFNRLTSQDLFLDAGSGTNDRVVLRAGSSSSMQVAETFIMNVKAVIYTYSGFTSSLDIDCREGNYFTRTISSDSTFTFSNVPAASGFNVAYSFTLELTHTSGTVTWPSTVKWSGNTAPSLTTGKTHLFMFVTDDAGSRWRGSYLTNYDN